MDLMMGMSCGQWGRLGNGIGMLAAWRGWYDVEMHSSDAGWDGDDSCRDSQ